jgi:siroheme synthase (precorrin-2 oxidase/ferrochelatase)
VARTIARDLRKQFDGSFGIYLELIGSIRKKLIKQVPDYHKRLAYLEKLLAMNLKESIANNSLPSEDGILEELYAE